MQDTYLDKEITDLNIAEATAYIETVYPLVVDEYHRARLINFYVYLLTCLDNQSEEGDIFGIKYKQYKKLFDDALKIALDSIKASAGISSLSIEIGRN